MRDTIAIFFGGIFIVVVKLLSETVVLFKSKESKINLMAKL